MAHVKKISSTQFLLDCINKEYEIVDAPLRFNTYEELLKYTEDHKAWYTEFSFTSDDQYNAWKSYFYDHYYDWRPKKVSKTCMKHDFGVFDLYYGFKQDY